VALDLTRFEPPNHEIPHPVARCVVTTPPTSASDSLKLALLNMTALYTYTVGPGHWSARSGAFPTLGTQGIVVFDDNNDAWLVGWEGVGVDKPPAQFQRRWSGIGNASLLAWDLYQTTANGVTITLPAGANLGDRVGLLLFATAQQVTVQRGQAFGGMYGNGFSAQTALVVNGLNYLEFVSDTTGSGNWMVLGQIYPVTIHQSNAFFQGN